MSLAALIITGCVWPSRTPNQTVRSGTVVELPSALSPLPSSRGAWADSVLATLSLRDKAAQLVWPWMLADYQAYNSPGWQRLASLMQEQHVGGIIMSVGAPLEMASKINGLQYLSPTPLLVSADLEGGAGFRARSYFVPNALDLGGATLFPQNMAFGAARDEQLAYELGRVTAREARALGLHIAFAPVMDVNNNPANPVIGTRSYGEDPQLVARLGAATIRGLQEHGVVATAKHFPGHGDTEVNSHLGLPVVPVSRERLDRVELFPFAAAVRAGVNMVMTAHMALPAVTGDSTPATLAPAVMRDLLRRDLGFRGILATDAMDMRGVLAMGLAEATKRAVEAGNDVILMPPDVPTAIDAIVAGVREGRYTEARIDSSARRLLELKERLGLHQNRYVELDKVRAVVGDAEHLAIAQRAAERGITLVKDGPRVVPLQLTPRPAASAAAVGGAEPSSRTDILSVTVARRADLGAGRDFNAELRTRFPAMRQVFVDSEDAEFDYERVLRMSDLAEVTIVSSYALAGFDVQQTNRAPRAFVEFVRELQRRPTRAVVVAFGNPYLLREIPDVPTYMIAWSGFPVAQRAAARAILGITSISGRLPIAIPPVAAMGAGLQRTGKGR